MASNVLVRPARASDPAVIGSIQARAWGIAYAELLPAQALAALTPSELTPVWREAVLRPPSPKHGVFVAVSDDLVVGFASVAPSDDHDANGETGALGVLAVDPGHQQAGHGSRLLSAAVDHLRNHGLNAMTVWVPEADEARARFFTSAGMVADGARRSFAGPGGATVTEVRYGAEISGA
ncbi:GNAT family N-acetyltransferase [Kineosporia sp. J2-2]|uniref:GNAT family N-acetyltransferase n=1 Tax=Kineosporia corallincola TaxID=2835133 RepID=A0ABS5TSY6_9ACTN|nr:GNAT family N-acetyltransferase [Kineosporia corallincola]MBT0773901.1 GNAT family N-acetyltransferase [Kineosporia corallincola]